MCDSLKLNSFEHPISDILNLKFGESEKWLHLWKHEFANTLEPDGQDVCLGFRVVIGGQHERRLVFITCPLSEVNHRGTRILNPIKVKVWLYLENLLASLDFDL